MNLNVNRFLVGFQDFSDSDREKPLGVLPELIYNGQGQIFEFLCKIPIAASADNRKSEIYKFFVRCIAFLVQIAYNIDANGKELNACLQQISVFVWIPM